LFSVQPFFAWWCFAFFPVQRDLKAFRYKALSDVLHRFGTAQKRLGDLLVGPVGTIGIGLEQNLSPPHFLRRSFQFLNHTAQDFPFLFREPNNILLFHGNPPWLPTSLRDLAKSGNPNLNTDKALADWPRDSTTRFGHRLTRRVARSLLFNNVAKNTRHIHPLSGKAVYRIPDE
jgi:hypothetical protein